MAYLEFTDSSGKWRVSSIRFPLVNQVSSYDSRRASEPFFECTVNADKQVLVRRSSHGILLRPGKWHFSPGVGRGGVFVLGAFSNLSYVRNAWIRLTLRCRSDISASGDSEVSRNSVPECKTT